MHRKLLLVVLVAFVALVGSPGIASAWDDDHRVFVCKYVGQPFVDERLQTGDNPISVDVHAIEQDPVEIGDWFQDQHGRSYVLAWDEGQDEPDASECPAPAGPTTTVPDETTTTVGETTTTAPETTTTPTTSPCTEPRGCPPPPQPTNPDGSLRLGGPDGPDGAQPLPETGTSSGALAGFAVGLLAVGLAMTRKFRLIRSDGSNHE